MLKCKFVISYTKAFHPLSYCCRWYLLTYKVCAHCISQLFTLIGLKFYIQFLLSSDAQEHIAESNGKIRMLEEGDIELTLSLGPSSCNPRRRKMGKSESGQSISSSSTGSSQTRKTSPKENNTITWAGFPHQGSGMEPGFSNGQQNSNPPWLYQALSLKLTWLSLLIIRIIF